MSYGHRHDVGGAGPVDPQAALGVAVELAVPAELHARGCTPGARISQGLPMAQPVVGLLDLLAGDDALAEHAVLVADAVAEHRQLQRRAGIEEAGREAAEAAVAEAGVGLLGDHVLHLRAEAAQGAAELVLDAEVERGVAQGAAHEELHRQVVAALAVAGVVGGVGGLPALHQAVAQRQGGGHVAVAVRHRVAVAAEGVGEVAVDVGAQAVGVHAQPGRRERLGVGGLGGVPLVGAGLADRGHGLPPGRRRAEASVGGRAQLRKATLGNRIRSGSIKDGCGSVGRKSATPWVCRLQ